MIFTCAIRYFAVWIILSLIRRLFGVWGVICFLPSITRAKLVVNRICITFIFILIGASIWGLFIIFSCLGRGVIGRENSPNRLLENTV